MKTPTLTLYDVQQLTRTATGWKATTIASAIPRYEVDALIRDAMGQPVVVHACRYPFDGCKHGRSLSIEVHTEE